MNIRVTMATFYPLRKTPACIYTHWKYWLKMAQQYGWLVLKVNTELYLAQWLFFHLACSEAYTRNADQWAVARIQDHQLTNVFGYWVWPNSCKVLRSFWIFLQMNSISWLFHKVTYYWNGAGYKIFQETNRDCTMITGTFITSFIGLKDQWKLKQWTTPEFSTFSSEIVIYQ